MSVAQQVQGAVEKARAYVNRNGRPVDAAELAFHLGRGRADATVEMLYAYRNPDGGFGHAFEPDVRYPGSTVLATSVALQCMVRTKVDPYHPLVGGAMRFILDTYDMRTKNWPLVTEEAKKAPCAPWWKGYEVGNPSALNPRAEILSYFIRFDRGQHEALHEEVRRAVLSRLAKEEQMEMHEALCVARLHRTPGLDATLERATREALERDLPKLLPKNKEECKGYVLKPMTIARRPNSVLAGLVEPAVPIQHAFELEIQAADGSWSPAWNWAEVDAEAWKQAEREWKSNLTMFTASSLYAYGR